FSFRSQENKNAPVEQDLAEIHIKVEAAPLSRIYENERNIKEALKDKVKDVYFYRGKYRNIEYSVLFAVYVREIETKSIIKAVEDSLKDNNLILRSENNGDNGIEGILLEGFFDKDNKKYVLRGQILKKGAMLWQILAVYPVSKNSDALSQRFIDSIEIKNAAEIK
ncbi:MAG: hypothetical protein LBH29_04160, partial [Elusimicrobiota bacterium]|nr:hypothetical protein [Elusimicrobiota bacterium]